MNAATIDMQREIRTYAVVADYRRGEQWRIVDAETRQEIAIIASRDEAYRLAWQWSTGLMLDIGA